MLPFSRREPDTEQMLEEWMKDWLNEWLILRLKIIAARRVEHKLIRRSNKESGDLGLKKKIWTVHCSTHWLVKMQYQAINFYKCLFNLCKLELCYMGRLFITGPLGTLLSAGESFDLKINMSQSKHFWPQIIGTRRCPSSPKNTVPSMVESLPVEQLHLWVDTDVGRCFLTLHLSSFLSVSNYSPSSLCLPSWNKVQTWTLPLFINPFMCVFG